MLKNKGKILVVDDEESLRFTFSSFLQNAGYEVDSATDFDTAMETINQHDYDVIISDILLGQQTGIDLLREIKKKKPNCYVLMITGYPNVESASEAVRLGAFDYISKPVREDDLLRVTKIALLQKGLDDSRKRHLSHINAILNNIHEGIVTFDPRKNIISMNHAARNLLRLGDLPGATARFNDISDDCLRACAKLVNRTMVSQQTNELKRFACKIGDQEKNCNRVFTFRTTPMLDESGIFLGAVLVIQDETILVDLETNLKKRQRYQNIIGKCKKMQDLFTMLDQLKNLRTTVLIYGETGTGKELVVDAMHYNSDFCKKPLIKVNCAALPENLLESELFGHVKGAFTGAVQDKIGRFQKADGGTIMLDEVGEISPRMQLRLLRILQEKEFERVGDTKTIKVDVRIVAATNKDLWQCVQDNTFREDLYFRLNVVELTVPPLREKRQDIPILIQHFIKKYNTIFGKDIHTVTDEAKNTLLEYSWPGNIRELENTIEHAFVVCHEPIIDTPHFPAAIKRFQQSNLLPPEITTNNEREKIIEYLEKTDWNKAKAARLLGISRQKIYRRIIEYDILPR